MRDSFTCPRCAATKFPGFTLGPKSTLVVECPKCQYQDMSLGPADFSQGVACVTEDGVPSAEPGWSGKRMVAVADLPMGSTQPPPRPTTYAPGPTVAPMPAPRDVIGMIEERAAWLLSEEARIAGEIAESQARLAGVRAESKRLQKMLQSGAPRARRAAPLQLKLAR